MPVCRQPGTQQHGLFFGGLSRPPEIHRAGVREAETRAFNLDPDGNFLYAAGEKSGKMLAYRINTETAELKLVETYPVGKGPSWISPRNNLYTPSLIAVPYISKFRLVSVFVSPVHFALIHQFFELSTFGGKSISV